VLPPVQITKKSVNPPAFRRSSTTTSSAFLSSALARHRQLPVEISIAVVVLSPSSSARSWA
jgi:hypothetical protein